MSVQQTSSSYKILVVTSCTKDKVFPAQISNHSLVSTSQLWDSRDDDRALRDYGELEQYRRPAASLYHGLQHTELMQGVKLLRRAFGRGCIDVKIVSAGFGVVDEHQMLPPYEATFADQSQASITAVASLLRIPQKIRALLAGAYDCAFFLLGDQYLLSLGLPFDTDPPFPCLFLASPDVRTIPRRLPYALIPAGNEESSAFRYNLVGLKGHLFRLFVEQMVAKVPNALSWGPCVQTDEPLESFFLELTPQSFLSSIQPRSRSNPPEVAQLSLFTNTFTQEKRAKNYGRPMRYFVPDWDDLVDPGYDFEADKGTPGKRRYDDEVYAHQIYEQPNYDGLLFSKGPIEDGAAKFARVKELGIHRFAQFPDRPIFGDCGAFSYISSEVPPYQTPEILDYYQNLGFNYGVSIDHLIIPAFYPVREFRYELTRKNAREFIDLYKAGGYTFTPVGVAQGCSPETYKKAVIELLELGYQYVALGGVARTPTHVIHEILKAVAPVLQVDTDLHLFGVARDREGDEMRRFRELGVTSFDSASYLRRSWLSETANYITLDGGRYTALRISPITARSPRVKKILDGGHVTFEQLQKLERNALKALREYDRGRLDLETALAILLEMDKMEGHPVAHHEQLYRRTLEDQPWKRCVCAVCRDLGIEVMIFRGNDRNRRRGFHNTFTFYKRFRKLMERES